MILQQPGKKTFLEGGSGCAFLSVPHSCSNWDHIFQVRYDWTSLREMSFNPLEYRHFREALDWG